MLQFCLLNPKLLLNHTTKNQPMTNKKNTYTIYDTPKKNQLIGAILAGKLVAEATVMFDFRLFLA
jgi:hypothetical protein